MKFSTVRHGPAKYENVAHSGDFSSKDLKESDIPEVERKARAFADTVGADETVTVWSSPIPRSLETAAIFETALSERGIRIRKKKVFKDLEEARNFRWTDFAALVNGGTFTNAQGVKHVVDAAVTNPEKLTTGTYFRTSAWTKIPQWYRQQFPEDLRKKFDIEPYEKIVSRNLKFLQRLSFLAEKGGGHQQRVAVFTHQCCSDFLLELVNDYLQGGVDPADAITLDFVDGDFAIAELPEKFEGKTVSRVIEETGAYVRRAIPE